MSIFRTIFFQIILFASCPLGVLASEDSELGTKSTATSGASDEDPDEVKRVENIGYIKPPEHLVGAVLGVFPGFGLGHAIQGRYAPVGGLYAAAEVAGIFMLFTTAYSTAGCEHVNRCYGPYALAGASALFLVGAKLSEIYDVIVEPFNINKKYKKYRKLKLITGDSTKIGFGIAAVPSYNLATDKSVLRLPALSVSVVF